MAKKKKDSFKLLKVAGGILLIIGGISGFSANIIKSNFIGVLISAIAFFVGLWLIGQIIE